MATESVTTEQAFSPIPVDDTHLLSVRAGVDAFQARMTADALYSVVRARLFEAIHHGGMDEDEAYLCEFAMDAAYALRASVGEVA